MSPYSGILTPDARRHIARMGRAIAPAAPRLQKSFARRLAKRGYRAEEIRALSALTPAAASQLRTTGQFLEQVHYNSSRLRKLNVPPSAALEALAEFGDLVQPILGGRFQPASEQLFLVTSLILNQAYYQVREAETQALFGIYRAEAEANGVPDLLKRMVRVLTPALRARAGRIAAVEDGADELDAPRYIVRGEPAERLILDTAIRGRYASYWSYPLAPGMIAQFGFAMEYPWLPRELALLEAAGERIRAASDRAKLRADNRRLETQAAQAEDEERRRIGRELHDETGQALLLLRLQLEMMERGASPELKAHLAEARGVAENAIAEVRRIVASLSPSILERLGLEAAVRHLVTRFQKRCPAKARLQLRLGGRPAPVRVRDAVYRVAQEALENIARHSGAKNVKILLESTDTFIRLTVSDDGAGFAASAVSKPMSFGLTGMRQRAALLGGTLVIKTAPGQGVRVGLELPITEAREKDERL